MGGSTGSSPLARGTRGGGRRTGDAHRFIPARAGNTRLFLHPGAGCHGSSPLARGTPAPRLREGRQRRFIPARAGNTSSAVSAVSSATVHPRSRGEHQFHSRAIRSESGSSPLARGTPRSDRLSPAGIRFIPARAGNTHFTFTEDRRHTVHPRSRGEHRAPSSVLARSAGSSPLARGTLQRGMDHSAAARFIPARAGNTAPAPNAARSRTVHPRSRGEHQGLSGAFQATGGSSPLARGTPGVPREHR